MKYRRSYNTLTVLPDGKVLTTGGQNAHRRRRRDDRRAAGRDVGSGHGHVDDDGLEPPAAPVPLVGGPAARRPRPAGRRRRLRQRQERAAAARSTPRRTSSRARARPSPPRRTSVHYGQSFTRRHAGRQPDHQGLAGPHGLRHAQRRHGPALHGPVDDDGLGRRSAISGPANANVAPPGYYMVFLVDDQGVPSMGQIVQVDAVRRHAAADAPVTAWPPRTQADGANLSWSASSDNEGGRRVPRLPLDDRRLHAQRGQPRSPA